MSVNKYLLHFALCAGVAASAVTVFAQAEPPQTWAQDITYLEQLAPSEAAAQQNTILQIRTEVALWIAAHPKSGIQLSPLPSQTLNADQAVAQLAELQKAVTAIVAQDPSHPFHLGVTEVEVSATLSPLSPTADSINQGEIQEHDATNVAKSLDLLQGVEIQHLAGNRNETSVYLRGFTGDGRVPIYLDGIPQYVPYDGYIDLNRFLTSDIGEIQVAPGFSSPLLGPNALGGTVNMVTREPSKKLEGDLAMGTYSGNGLLSSLRVGSMQTRFLFQGTLDWLQDDYIPLSGNFAYPMGGYTALIPGNKANTATGCTTPKGSCNVPYAYTDQENNSNTRDEKFGGRIGWLPKNGGQYIFSYINQKGKKSDPLYQGANAAASFKNFWTWPYWNKDSYYFLSDTKLGEQSGIKFRVYYDQLRNSIDMYDNSQYNSMTNFNPGKNSAEVSNYDDHTDGASTEFTTRLIKHNVLGASLFFKDDTHNAVNVYPGAPAYYASQKTPPSAAAVYLAEYNPVQNLRDQQFSNGYQDLITFNSRLHATLGFSADHLKGLKQQYLNGANQPTTGTLPGTELLAYTCPNDPTNTSYSGCTAHFWNYNPQGSLTYTASSSDVLFATYEDRGAFPTLKERYSTGMGSSLPNPELMTEHSQNWNFGYTHTFGTKLTMDGVLYLSKLRNAIESATVLDPGWNQASDPKDLNGMCPGNSNIGHCGQYVNIGKETHEGVEVRARANPVQWFKLDTNYTYLNRTIGNQALAAGTSLSSPLVLPTGLPKNKLIGTGTFLLPYQILGIVTARYEGGVTLQDTSYSSTTQAQLYAPYGESLATFDLAANIPVRTKFAAQVGIKNLLDRNYAYTAGYPEEGRNWFINLRYHF
jgi:iron complex outermembrane receptor protein